MLQGKVSFSSMKVHKGVGRPLVVIVRQISIHKFRNNVHELDLNLRKRSSVQLVTENVRIAY